MATQAPQPPQGMHDHLPDAYRQRLALADRIRSVYATYGYAPIETPAMERIEILKGSGGGENEKLMYEILKRGEKLATAGDALSDHALRFDLTVPLARFYATHHARLPPVFRCQHIGPAWRAERPQKGRLRELMQCDVDAVGSSSPMMEAEVILATSEVMRGLLGEACSVHINDRRLLTAFLDGAGVSADRHETSLIALDKTEKIGEEGVLKELSGRGIPSGASLLASMKEARSWAWDRPELKDLKEIRDLVGSGAALVFDPFLARGMGYYTGPIFEIRMEGAPGSLGGGGRYDGLIGRFLGRSVPAVGFSIGFERLVLMLQEKGIRLDAAGAPRVFVPFVEGMDRAKVFDLGALLRAKGLNTIVGSDPGKLVPQLRTADEILAIPYAAILEADGKVTVKDLKSRKAEPPALPGDAAAFLSGER